MAKHFIGFLGFLLASFLGAALVTINEHANVQPREGAPDAEMFFLVLPPKAAFRADVELEVRLLAKGSDVQGLCGDVHPHQVAKYQVLRVIYGSYERKTIIVEHPSCDGGALKDIPIGAVLDLQLRVWAKEQYRAKAGPLLESVSGIRSSADLASTAILYVEVGFKRLD